MNDNDELFGGKEASLTALPGNDLEEQPGWRDRRHDEPGPVLKALFVIFFGVPVAILWVAGVIRLLGWAFG